MSLLYVQQGKGKEEELPEEEEEELEEEELLEDEEDDVEPEKRWEMERESIAMANMAAELQVSSSAKSVHVVYTYARRPYATHLPEDESRFCIGYIAPSKIGNLVRWGWLPSYLFSGL